MENYLPFTPVYNEAFLALLHELTEIVNSGFNHFSTTNNPDIYLSITGLYKSVFEDGNFDWFNSDMCMLYLNASHIYKNKSVLLPLFIKLTIKLPKVFF